jgi:hypothetical protein
VTDEQDKWRKTGNDLCGLCAILWNSGPRARAPGQPGYVHNTTVSFGGVSAKYVRLTIEKGWGTTPAVGLSEVRFFYIPTASAPKP